MLISKVQGADSTRHVALEHHAGVDILELTEQMGTKSHSRCVVIDFECVVGERSVCGDVNGSHHVEVVAFIHLSKLLNKVFLVVLVFLHVNHVVVDTTNQRARHYDGSQ